MKAVIYSAIIILFFVLLQENSNGESLNDECDKNCGVLTVNTQTCEKYDDGFYRKEYAPFQICNMKNEIVLAVGNSWDVPANVKLPEGEYKVIQDNITKTVIVKSCSQSEVHF